jgi:hypothetical protein
MGLDEAFRNYREKIVNQWVDYALSTYKDSKFFLKEKDKFSNPVGGNVRESFDKLYVLLTKNKDPQELVAPLEQFIRIRSVQDFTASQAVSPLHAIKHITRGVLEKDKDRKYLVNELYDFEFAVDMAVLAAFDLYMINRERLANVRIEEIRSGKNLITDSRCPSRLLNDIKKE